MCAACILEQARICALRNLRIRRSRCGSARPTRPPLFTDRQRISRSHTPTVSPLDQPQSQHLKVHVILHQTICRNPKSLIGRPNICSRIVWEVPDKLDNRWISFFNHYFRRGCSTTRAACHLCYSTSIAHISRVRKDCTAHSICVPF